MKSYDKLIYISLMITNLYESIITNLYESMITNLYQSYDN